MHIRVAAATDIAEMHRIRLSVRENKLSDPTTVRLQDYSVMMNEKGRGWVADVNGRIAGFAVADATRANVWALFVDPEFEGFGIGRRLHDTMVDWLFASGVTQAWLSTDPGTRAEGFYLSAGWQPSGVEPGGEARYEMSRDSWRALQRSSQATTPAPTVTRDPD